MKKDSDKVWYILSKYEKDPALRKAELKKFDQSGQTADAFIREYLSLYIRLSKEDIDKDLKEADTRPPGSRGFGWIIGLVVLLIGGGIIYWQQWGKAELQDEQADTDKLVVITTTGLLTRKHPSTIGPWIALSYGDTVTNMYTTGKWLKLKKGDTICYAPPSFLTTPYKFSQFDSLFEGYHYRYRPNRETINSKISMSLLDFVSRSLPGGLQEWYVPLEERRLNALVHASLTLPKPKVYIPDEGRVEKFHFIVITRRDTVVKDSVNSYLLLMSITEDGEVIRDDIFPVNYNSTAGRVIIQSFRRFETGDVENNVYFADGNKIILRLTMVQQKKGDSSYLAPRWVWHE
ncbi:MAG TPA: hypothetical protein VD993_15505 [Chitinophagaceae bacterium]|nr:hypothetical protein [Chitinophagaceae bacterium]